MEYVHSLTENDRRETFPERYLNWNISEVLSHLHHWHLRFLHWNTVGMKGDKPEMPAKGYSWKTLPDLHREIHKMNKKIRLKEAKEMKETTFNVVQEIIEKTLRGRIIYKKEIQMDRLYIIGRIFNFGHF